MATAPNNYDFLEPAETPDDLGRLGHYRVIRELGRGGMGFVFQAEDVKLKRSVALKVMNQKIAATAGSRQRFISEARAMAAIRHDNVATIFEVGQRNDTPFMAMEMLAGGTLEEANRIHKPMGFRDVIRYARQIAEGLAAAHERGIVHRDIKPANIWIEAGIDRIKILDFGLALASSPTDTLAGRGSVIGTPGYLSPEQARTEPLDDRSDLYSLGAVLYEMCTGKLPISSKSVHEQLIAILTQKPKPVSELNPEIPTPLSDLITRLLKKEPRARVKSADALIEQLDSVAEECERSTDVAQTIDRLQSGLTNVLGSQSPVTDAMPVANPFDTADPSGMMAAIPDPLAMPPGGSGVMPAVPMGSSGAIPVAGINRPVPAKAGSAAKGDSSPMKIYLPLAIVVLLAIIALPLMTFAFTGFGGSNENVVITLDPATQAQNAGNQNQAAANANQGNPNQGGPNRGATANQSKNQWKKKNQWKNKNSGNQNKQASGNGNQSQPNSSNNAKNDAAGSNPAGNGSSGGPASSDMTSVETLKPMIPDPTPVTPKVEEPVSPQPNQTVLSPANTEMATTPAPGGSDPVEPPSRWVQLSTSDGGADAMVQSGTSERYGNANSFGVRTRNGVETNHSYLAFKLKDSGAPRKQIAEAKLVVSVTGNRFPVGGSLRLYGVGRKLQWPEKSLIWKNSFSSEGLDGLPLLVETTIDSDDENDRWVSLGSEELTQFVKSHDYDYLTFVLAGEFGDAMIRMVSKEKSPERAPKLGLRVLDRPQQ